MARSESTEPSGDQLAVYRSDDQVAIDRTYRFVGVDRDLGTSIQTEAPAAHVDVVVPTVEVGAIGVKTLATTRGVGKLLIFRIILHRRLPALRYRFCFPPLHSHWPPLYKSKHDNNGKHWNA